MPGATFVQGDALDLPFEDGAFDRLFTSYFYCHLEEDDRERFLDEARRVARELVVVGSRAQPGEELDALGHAHAPGRERMAGLQAGLRPREISPPSSAAASSTRTATS